MTVPGGGGNLADTAVRVIARVEGFSESLRAQVDAALTRVSQRFRRAFSVLERDSNKSGQRVGEELADGVTRGADGKLRDARGRFIATGDRAGDSTGRGFLSGFLHRLRDINVGGVGALGQALAGFGGIAASTAGPLAALTAGMARLLAVLGAAGIATVAVQALTGAAVGLAAELASLAPAVAVLPAAFAAAGATAATLVIGLQGMGDAFKALAAGDPKKLAEALKGLAPNARAFVRELRALGPAVSALRLDVQNRLFANLASTTARLANAFLPRLRVGFAGIATALNAQARAGARALIDPRSLAATTILLSNTRQALAALTPVIAPVVSAFADLGAVGSDFLPRIAAALAAIGQRFAAVISAAAQSDRLTAAINSALTTLQQLGSVAANTGRVLGDVFGAAQVEGGGLLATLGALLGGLHTFLASTQGQDALVTFFASARQLGGALLPLLQDLATLLATAVAPSLASIGTALLPGLTAAVQGLGPALAGVGPALTRVFAAVGDSLPSLLPGIAALGQGIGQALGALAPAIGPILTSISVLAQGIGPILGQIAPAVIAVVQAISGALPSLLPGLAALGVAISSSLLALPQALTPLAQAVSAFVVALAPLLPLAAQLFTQVLAAAAPVLTQLAVALTPVIAQLTTALAPILPVIAALFGQLLAVIAPLVTQLVTALAPVLPALIAALVGMAQALAPLLPAVSGLVSALIPLVPALEVVITVLLRLAGPVISFVVQILRGLIGLLTVLVQAFQSAGRLVDAAVGAIGSAIGSAVRFGTGQVSALISVVSGIPGKIAGFAGKMLAAGKALITNLFNGLKSVASGASGLASSIGKAIVNKIIDGLNSVVPHSIGIHINAGPIHFNKDIPLFPNIPHVMAHGGILDRATLAVVGEAGTEAVLPLTRPADMRRLLAAPDVHGPILAAFAQLGIAGPPRGTAAGPVITNNITLANNPRDPEALAHMVTGRILAGLVR